MEPIRSLTRSNTEWEWTELQDNSMKEIKRMVTEAPILTFYDPAKELVIECDALPDTKLTTVIRKLKAHFARNGSPNYVVSDGGPQYMSEEFKRFAREWDFEHVTSSPHHQNANGKAEAAVKWRKGQCENERREMETYIKTSWSYVTHRVRV